jgi:hypothetical protein
VTHTRVITSDGGDELLGNRDDRGMEVGTRTSGKDRGIGHPQPRDPMDAPRMIDDRRRVGYWSHAARTRRVKRRRYILPHLSTALVTGTPYGQWSGERLDHRRQRRRRNQLRDHLDPVAQGFHFDRFREMAVVDLQGGVRIRGGQAHPATGYGMRQTQ